MMQAPTQYIKADRYDTDSILSALIINRRDRNLLLDPQKIACSAAYYLRAASLPYDYQTIRERVLQLIKSPATPTDLAVLRSPAVNKFLLPNGYRVRYAVNPNSEPTLMNLKGVVIHRLIQDANPNGTIYLRFDDTSPDNKPPTMAGYQGYLSAVRLFDLRVQVQYASDNLELYYRYGETLLRQGVAYLRRGYLITRDLDTYYRFLEGKTDHVLMIADKTPWVALRRCKNRHIRHPTRRVWPTLAFHSACDQYRLGISHIFRGIDLQASQTAQRTLLNVLAPDYTYPKCYYWGRHKLAGITVSSSKLVHLDPYRYNHPTLHNLLYYGVTPTAIYQFWKQIGLGPNASTINIGLLKKYCVPLKPALRYDGDSRQCVLFSRQHLTGRWAFHYCSKAFKKSIPRGVLFGIGSTGLIKTRGFVATLADIDKN